MTAPCYICKRLTDGYTLATCERCPERARICSACCGATFDVLRKNVERWRESHRDQCPAPPGYSAWEEFELGAVA